jgi:transposase InsO family protein
MYEGIPRREPEGVEESGAGDRREPVRKLPRLFGEREERGDEPGDGEGGAGGREGAGDAGSGDGGGAREEVWEVPIAVETVAGASGAGEPGAPPAGGCGPVEGHDGAPGGAGAVGEQESEPDEHAYDTEYVTPALGARRKGSPHKKLRKFEVRLGPTPNGLKAEQRLLLLDAWQRSGLAAGPFAELVGLSHHTLYAWKKRFEELGPAGLDEKPRGSVTGSRLPEATRRAILMMKQQHPDWGSERIHDMLMRSSGFTASAGAILRVLREDGYETVPVRTHPNPPVVHRFERARVNELWQTDLFTFLLKREGKRVYLIGFLDDHSRYMVGYGLYATSSGAVVREVFEEAIANYGAPREVLTDNGAQYHTWRGKSAFRELCERRGIKQIVARPRHPQTLGKIERFWGSLWRECLESAVFEGLADARRRVGLYIDHYNFHRPHQGVDGLVPADRFFEAAPEVLETLRARVAANALDLARDGEPRQSFYLTGRVGDEGISLHGEGGKVILTKSDGTREEISLEAQGRRAVLMPGRSLVKPDGTAEPPDGGTEPLAPPGSDSAAAAPRAPAMPAASVTEKAAGAAPLPAMPAPPPPPEEAAREKAPEETIATAAVPPGGGDGSEGGRS